MGILPLREARYHLSIIIYHLLRRRQRLIPRGVSEVARVAWLPVVARQARGGLRRSK